MVNFTGRSQTAHSWGDAKRLAREQKYKTKIKLSKQNAPFLPSEFEPSSLSIPGSANEVYRDQNPTDSFQIREYDDHWTIEMDQHNPETGKMVAHAVQDAPSYTLAALVVGAAIFGG
ncbi:hypothetical protein [Natronorubrum sp. FCH18a]|uniref:hypothetical protein n=1 Tax=Natronorubrum sp. FCH18a TaxID=3447018 RepID=UPI003F5102DA